MSITFGDRARQLIRTSLVWDNHGCMPLRTDDSFLPQLERYRSAGFSIVSINIGYGVMQWTEHLEILSHMRGWLSQRLDKYALISTADDVHTCRLHGKLGVVFDVEGMVPVQDDTSRVQILYELGVRWMLIAYNRNNEAGGGCLDQDTGLTAVGRAIIDKMQQVGMVLCLSHAGARTAAEALDYTTNPAIFSHSNPFGDTPHPRNVTDGLMRSCAEKGGVIGLSGIPQFLGAKDDAAGAIVRQLCYVIDLVGPSHVGLGLDYVFDASELEEHIRKHPTLFAAGTESGHARRPVAPEDLLQIVEGLAESGLSDADIRGILGGNWLRIARQVWQPASEIGLDNA
jgi:membrane dipeptidase